MLSLRKRIEASHSRVFGSPAKYSINIKRTNTTTLGLAQTDRIEKIILGPDMANAMQYLHAENVKTINLAEKHQARFEHEPGSQGKPSEAGEWTLYFDPVNFSELRDANKFVRVEHALWHIYLSTIFPSLDMDIKKLGLMMAMSYPQAKPFLEPFVHFFLRSASLEGERDCSGMLGERHDIFAVKDAGLEIFHLRSCMNRMGKDPSGIGLTALYCGTLFSTVFAFKLYSMYSDIEKEHHLRLLNEAKSSGYGETFVRANILANDIFRSVCLTGENNIKMDSFNKQLNLFWTDFIRKYPSKKMF